MIMTRRMELHSGRIGSSRESHIAAVRWAVMRWLSGAL
jgi:hypothetical protein